jgi:hypothetical protein
MVRPGRDRLARGWFRQQPSGTTSSMALKKPSFFGIVGSIIDPSWATT